MVRQCQFANWIAREKRLESAPKSLNRLGGTNRKGDHFLFIAYVANPSFINIKLMNEDHDSQYCTAIGNLLRSSDIRGYQSMPRMYTRLVVMPKKNVAKAFLHMFCSEMVILLSFF